MKQIVLISFLTILSALSLAQDPVALADEPGTWSYKYLNDANTTMYRQKFGMTEKESADFKLKLDRLAEILHRNPIMANPRGFDASVESRPYYPADFKDLTDNYGYIGEINLRLPQWFISKGRKYKQTIEPPRTTVYFNKTDFLKRSAFSVVATGSNKQATELVNDICRPMVIEELAPGVTLYDYAIVITKPGRKLFVPCTVGEAYNRLLSYYESAVNDEPYYSVLLDPIKEEHARLTPAQLNMPAYFGGPSGITWQPNADTLMIFNKNFFDRTKPKSAVQVIAFPINADYFRKPTDFVPNDVGYLRIYQFQHSLDFGAISQILD